MSLCLLAGMSVGLLGCVPIPEIVGVFLNKKGVTLQQPPRDWIENLRKEFGLRMIRIDQIDKIPHIAIEASQSSKVVSITSSVDLRPWFKNKKCAQTWESFDECRNKGVDPEDDRLQRRLDREFYSRVICQERCLDPEMDRDLLKETELKRDSNASCEDPEFIKWELRWPRPWRFVLKTEAIGKKWGFASAGQAKASLHRINELLGRVLPGARFPEDPSENHDMDVYSEETRSIYVDPGLKLPVILKRLRDVKYLQGLSPADIEAIGRVARGGKSIYYLPKGCPKEEVIPECFVREDGAGHLQKICPKRKRVPGWYAISNGNRINFSEEGCPKIEVLK
ncbi:hypothetical protein [Nitratifractor salsuginis]|uniref:hypothetical protein n=1 Tax=Nitratifractor salsuginis TaxID=269261 RepID=UPI0002F8EB69|nr:hypothetical protein [Nitratifractor salsuginis]